MDDSKILMDQEVMFTFDEFVKMRVSMKKKPTLHAINLLLMKLVKISGDNPDKAVEILNRSIINNWLDLYEPKQDNGSVESHITANQKAKNL